MKRADVERTEKETEVPKFGINDIVYYTNGNLVETGIVEAVMYIIDIHTGGDEVKYMLSLNRWVPFYELLKDNFNKELANIHNNLLIIHHYKPIEGVTPNQIKLIKSSTR